MPELLLRHFFCQTSEVYGDTSLANFGSLLAPPLLKYVKNKHLALLISIFGKQEGLMQPISRFF